MDVTVLERAGVADADAAVVATDGDNTNIVIGQVLQQRYDVATVVVRILDPARAKLYADRGHEHRLPDADRDLGAARNGPRREARERRLMYALVAGGGKVGSNVTRSLLAAGSRGDDDRAATGSVRAARGGVRAGGDPR